MLLCAASSMFSASLSIASILWKADDWTLARLLKEGHVTAAIATMSFLPETESVTQVVLTLYILYQFDCMFICSFTLMFGSSPGRGAGV